MDQDASIPEDARSSPAQPASLAAASPSSAGTLPDDAPAALGSAEPEWIAPPQGTPSSGRRGLVALVVVIVSVVAGGVGVLLGYVLFSDNSPEVGSAEANFDVACGLAEHINETHGAPEDWGGLDDPALWEAMALGPLLGSMEFYDSRYESLGEIGLDISREATRFDLDGLNSSITDAVSECRAR